jgi:hypothetical protein
LKRKALSGETAETINLTLSELQRLVLLEQLRYTRMKIQRFESQNASASCDDKEQEEDITDLDEWGAKQQSF